MAFLLSLEGIQRRDLDTGAEEPVNFSVYGG